MSKKAFQGQLIKRINFNGGGITPGDIEKFIIYWHLRPKLATTPSKGIKKHCSLLLDNFNIYLN